MPPPPPHTLSAVLPEVFLGVAFVCIITLIGLLWLEREEGKVVTEQPPTYHTLKPTTGTCTQRDLWTVEGEEIPPPANQPPAER